MASVSAEGRAGKPVIDPQPQHQEARLSLLLIMASGFLTAKSSPSIDQGDLGALITYQ